MYQIIFKSPMTCSFVDIVKDTKDYKTYKVINLTTHTLWSRNFSSFKEAENSILNFKNKFLDRIIKI